MALQKQSLPISFAQGLDTKTDPLQVSPGRFLALNNTVFSKGGLLQKRNGFGALAALPDALTTYATTFDGNLTAIGQRLRALSAGSNTWIDKGTLHPVNLSTVSLIRSNTPQTQVDAVVAANGLVCTVYTDNVAGSPVYKYAVADSTTTQNIIAPTDLATTVAGASGVPAGSPRVFLLGNFFIIVFPITIGATNELFFFSINTLTASLVSANAVSISASYTPSSQVAFDGIVANNQLYVAWNGADGGGAIRMIRIDSNLIKHNTVVLPGYNATNISLCADTAGNLPNIYVTWYNSTGPASYMWATDSTMLQIMTPVALGLPASDNLTTSCNNNVCTVIDDVHNVYTFGVGAQSNYIQSKTVTRSGSTGTVSSATTLTRGVGLASKAFTIGTDLYFLAVYGSAYQPTYFLLNATGQVVAKLSYSNGYGYNTKGLPSITVQTNSAILAFLKKDLIQAVNKSQTATSVPGVYSQTGINLATFKFNTSSVTSSEAGDNLNISGGFLWAYDGVTPVEQNFHLWPDDIYLSTAGGGSMSAQTYWYQVTYEWSDNQGNFFKSAPSVPQSIAVSGSGSVTLKIPTLRLTYKTSNPVKIVIYRWSTAQQSYYQVTSLTSPTLNSTTVDNISYTDTLADASILGNELLYTTGGVVENIGPPATDIMTLFNSRLWLVDAEDPNLLWFSKQLIESTPVEMSDLLTVYVSPSVGAQGATGPMTALSPMDDKLIIFKKNAIYYIAGNGPDNTGANNQYSDPVFIAGTVGCANPQSVVIMPQGLMFQSDKGIWLLGRDISTNYIGAPVEGLTAGATVLSALTIPGTNQVRFTLNTGITLVYDYYFGQWSSFVNIPATSACLYQSKHSYINNLGQVFQETPNVYLDGTTPTVMSFTTGWLSFAGLQGFERAYEMFILGTYASPHKLSIQIAYDFNPSPTQTTTLTPDNFNGYYGDDSPYGSGNIYGGPNNVEQWRVFFERQKCQSFQLSIQEIYDPTMGRVSGAGLTISGLNLTVGTKLGRPKLSASRSIG